MMETVLGIETSTVMCSVAVVDEAGRAVERSIREPHAHSEKLLTIVQEVLTASGLRVSDLSAVAVSIGPGSFTGLRIGLSTAKGLCYALGVPMIAVPTFEAIAAAVVADRPDVHRVAVVADARQGDCYVASFLRGADGLRSDVETQVIAADRLHTVVRFDERTTLVADEGAMAMLDKREVVASFHEYCRAVSVARLGLRKPRLRDWGDLEPVYLKDFIVRTQRTSIFA
jgi:tRNA threonylcarbamoyladenosine biosynthesis protein TsaB